MSIVWLLEKQKGHSNNWTMGNMTLLLTIGCKLTCCSLLPLRHLIFLHLSRDSSSIQASTDSENDQQEWCSQHPLLAIRGRTSNTKCVDTTRRGQVIFGPPKLLTILEERLLSQGDLIVHNFHETMNASSMQALIKENKQSGKHMAFIAWQLLNECKHIKWIDC